MRREFGGLELSTGGDMACEHRNTAIWLFEMSNGVTQYSRYCATCHEQLSGALKHRWVATNCRVEEIPHRDQVRGNRRKWWARKAEARRHAWWERYDAYLNSPEWKALRQRIIDRDKVCQVCGASIDVVHHKTYERVGHERMDDLVGLCHQCHEAVHEYLEKRRAQNRCNRWR